MFTFGAVTVAEVYITTSGCAWDLVKALLKDTPASYPGAVRLPASHVESILITISATNIQQLTTAVMQLRRLTFTVVIATCDECCGDKPSSIITHRRFRSTRKISNSDAHITRTVCSQHKGHLPSLWPGRWHGRYSSFLPAGWSRPPPLVAWHICYHETNSLTHLCC